MGVCLKAAWAGTNDLAEQALYQQQYQTHAVSLWMDDCISLSISGDSLSDEILNQGPW